MLYIIIVFFFLIWAAVVVRKGHMSWHSIAAIYVCIAFVEDYGDEVFDYWLNLYDLPTRLLNNPESDQYLGLTISDGVIFPLIAIVFCYYAAKYRRPWLLCAIFAPFMALIELVLANLGYMVCFSWNHLYTLAISFIGLRILAHFAGRLVNYSPPVSYRFWLFGMIYAWYAWVSAIFSWGILHLFQYRPHIFEDYTADDRIVSLALIAVLGAIVVFLAPKIRAKYKPFLFLSLGVFSFLFALFMYSKGWLLYHGWNHFWMFVFSVAPCYLMFLSDRWETMYLETLNQRYT